MDVSRPSRVTKGSGVPKYDLLRAETDKLARQLKRHGVGVGRDGGTPDSLSVATIATLRDAVTALIDKLRMPARGGRRYRVLHDRARLMLRALKQPVPLTLDDMSEPASATPTDGQRVVHLSAATIHSGSGRYARVGVAQRAPSGNSVRTVSGGLPGHGKRR